ncbi:hypothetical protein IAT38_007650 [Cryptococcus sp. DSM 104549]
MSRQVSSAVVPSSSTSITKESIDSNGNFIVASSTAGGSSAARQSTARSSTYHPVTIHSSSSTTNYYSSASPTSTTKTNYGISTDFVTYVTPTDTGSSSSYAASSSNPYAYISSSSAVDEGAASGNSTMSDNGGSSNNGHLSLTGVIAIACVVTLAVVGALLGCVMYKRRRRRLNKMPGEDYAFEDKPGGRRGQGGRSLETLDIPSLSHDAAFGSRSQPRLSQADIQGVLLPSPPPTATISSNTTHSLAYSHNHLSYYPPSRSHSHSASPFLDPSSTSASPHQQHSHLALLPSRSSSRRPESEYTDNSEFDMLAQDGSSYARTLSTYSEGVNSEYSERDLGTYVPPSQSTGTALSLTRPRLEVDTKSALGPGSGEGTWSGPGTATGTGGSSGGWGYAAMSSGSEPGTAVSGGGFMRNLVSPFADPPRGGQGAPSVISDRSWRTEDETLFARGAGVGVGAGGRGSPAEVAERGQGGLERGMTIVRHRDAGAVADEVHLPPSYGDLYPHPQ